MGTLKASYQLHAGTCLWRCWWNSLRYWKLDLRPLVPWDEIQEIFGQVYCLIIPFKGIACCFLDGVHCQGMQVMTDVSFIISWLSALYWKNQDKYLPIGTIINCWGAMINCQGTMINCRGTILTIGVQFGCIQELMWKTHWKCKICWGTIINCLGIEFNCQGAIINRQSTMWY